MSKLAGLSKGFLKWAVMAYISAFAALFIAQRPLVFGHYAFLQPAKPAWDAKLPGEKVALKTADGETLDAWYIPPAHSGRATIVYFHGKSANIAHKQQRMAELTRDGLGLFAVDYRGFGASTGSPSQEGLSADADAAYKWMTKRTGAEKLVVFGESLGSGVAVDLAARVPVGALVLEAPYTATVDVAVERYPLFPVRFVMWDTFPSVEKIARVKAPILIQHGKLDITIPVKFGEQLFAAAPEPKKLVLYDNAGHKDMPTHGSFRDLKEFVTANVEHAFAAR